MRIRVKQYFRGRLTNEQAIPPGIYEIDDPALFNCGEYLVEHKFAELLPEPEVIVEDAIEQPEEKPPQKTVKRKAAKKDDGE